MSLKNSVIVRLTCVHGLLQPVGRRDTAGKELNADSESSRRAAPAGVLEATRQVLPLVCHRDSASAKKLSNIFTKTNPSFVDVTRDGGKISGWISCGVRVHTRTLQLIHPFLY